MIKISEEIIPIPPKRMGRPEKYPMREMAVGQHFDVAEGDCSAKGQSLYSSAKWAGIKIAVRKIEGGYRVWRIE